MARSPSACKRRRGVAFAIGRNGSLTSPAGNTGEAAGDVYVAVEGLQGSSFNDMLTGDANPNDLQATLGPGISWNEITIEVVD